MNAISVAKSETKTKNGLLMYVVSLVLQFYVNGKITKGVQCLLPFPWYGGNQPTIWQIAIFYSSATSAWNYKEKKRTVSYPNILSAIRPVPHNEDLPVPLPPQWYILDSDDVPTENQEKTPQPFNIYRCWFYC